MFAETPVHEFSYKHDLKWICVGYMFERNKKERKNEDQLGKKMFLTV